MLKLFVTGNWGPHLIIVPTSVMLNWEMELKKWCPAFKILTYYGSQKERKQKRTGMFCVFIMSAFPFEEEYIVCLTSLPTGKESNVTFPTSQVNLCVDWILCHNRSEVCKLKVESVLYLLLQWTGFKKLFCIAAFSVTYIF